MKNTGLLFLSFSFWVVIYGQDSSTVPTQKAKPLVFTFVENNPHFPGGDKALHKFIEDNLQYPKDFKEKGIQQKVLIRFVGISSGVNTLTKKSINKTSNFLLGSSFLIKLNNISACKSS